MDDGIRRLAALEEAKSLLRKAIATQKDDFQVGATPKEKLLRAYLFGVADGSILGGLLDAEGVGKVIALAIQAVQGTQQPGASP